MLFTMCLVEKKLFKVYLELFMSMCDIESYLLGGTLQIRLSQKFFEFV